MIGEKNFSDRVGQREHIKEEIKGSEITEGEIKIVVEEFKKIDSEHKKLIERLIEEAKKDEKLLKFGEKTIKNMAEMVTDHDYEGKLYELGSKHGQELSEIVGIDDETLYQNGGTNARYYFDWLSAQDLTYTFSDLKINPDTGRVAAYDIKDAFQNAREKAIASMGNIYKTIK